MTRQETPQGSCVEAAVSRRCSLQNAGLAERSSHVPLVCAQSSSSTLRTNDQFLSLTDQLNLGVRAVELDTHWVEVRLSWAGNWIPLPLSA